MRLNSSSIACALMLGACTANVPPPLVSAQSGASAPAGPNECHSDSVSIAFDFEGAPPTRCAVLGERKFALLITPEHTPPINPSPWYAFRYEAAAGGDVTVELQYLSGWHRYAPILTQNGVSRPLAAEVSDDNETALLALPAGEGVVSAQELIGAEHYHKALERWAAATGTAPFELGRSHDGRPIEALRFGNSASPHLVVLLGRQHPPEVTGAIAMEAFVDRIAAMVAGDPALAGRYQFMVVPLLNPDGVARGHWRANLGGRDLNRDWGEFSQPETQAMKRWLDALPETVRPVLMLDFHSTSSNLFYVQGDEADAKGIQFRTDWLDGKEFRFPNYPFTINPSNANPGRGTTKNWFNWTYGIPAYTYEVDDDADRTGTRAAADALAEDLIPALDRLVSR